MILQKGMFWTSQINAGAVLLAPKTGPNPILMILQKGRSWTSKISAGAALLAQKKGSIPILMIRNDLDQPKKRSRGRPPGSKNRAKSKFYDTTERNVLDQPKKRSRGRPFGSKNKAKPNPRDPTGMNALDQPKKGRGRPPGSKNRAEPSVAIEEFMGAIRPLVLEMKTGCNIIHSLQQFCRRTQVGISVLTATGSVTNVTLRQAGQPSRTMHGIFNLKNISGLFTPPSWNLPARVLSTSLESPRGWIEGEIVGSHFTAAGTVTIVAVQLVNPVCLSIDFAQEDNSAIGNGNDNANVLPPSAQQRLQHSINWVVTHLPIFSTFPFTSQIAPPHGGTRPDSANGPPYPMP